ncbi:MAG TPA: bifunctional enoyl-CoA hydratase/phosphate acetyltransferase [Anaerolineae bacterium]|nr:bifunctional enoyl-CoA hydratase/phosphate acetyltransferase [Anaerolineae bacterium]HQJ50714.1 bifunctional enoyl-CoA hydratase/phosphate acetyltransferase [Anaerolineae bacterium]
MTISSFVELMAEAKKAGPRMVAIAAPHEEEILRSAVAAEEEGIANYTLVGDRERIRSVAADKGLDVSRMMVINEPDPRTAARKVMELLRMGHADLAMKGKIETGDFLRAALDREMGLRVGRLFSHVAVFEIPGFDRLLFVTDSGVVVAPTMEQKVEIVQNAISVAQRLGVKQPKVAILAATEMVNPKIPTTMDAANLAKMADRGQIQGGLVDGPLALDNAISPESVAIKGIKSAVAGSADILVTPDVEAGNMLAKAITYFARGKMAGVVVGAKSPLIVASRSDPHETKLISTALGVLLAS